MHWSCRGYIKFQTIIVPKPSICSVTYLILSIRKEHDQQLNNLRVYPWQLEPHHPGKQTQTYRNIHETIRAKIVHIDVPNTKKQAID